MFPTLPSYQNFLEKFKARAKSDLIQQLDAAKKNWNKNNTSETEKICSLETRLQMISEKEISLELENSPLFEHLNNEKMSSTFLKLAKVSEKDASLSDICNNDNNPFQSKDDRNKFITDFYKNLYKDENRAEGSFEGCIERFLGPEVLNNPIVQNAKLNETEKLNLEAVFSLGELDKSLLEAKTGSAGGMDGINNALLKKFWKYFRIPLHKYALCCFNKGQLTTSFKTAAIRLIPKKGNTNLIKNWRPISLLNCCYKILSRVINNRLKKVAHKLLSRAQKGFTSKRFIQECLINVIENIAYAKKNNIEGAIVAIDQAKAFDSVLNGYMNEVYKFFGFGNMFIDMMETLGNNRLACIILEDGSFSENFVLGKGRPQGDPPSPIQYNLAEQILLFKLELGAINPIVPMQVRVAGAEAAQEAGRVQEAHRETSATDAYADDTSVCTFYNFDDLNKLKSILLDFGNISGLCCNIEKSFLMRVGNRTTVKADILGLGFTEVDSIKILGLDIDFNLDCINTLHDSTVGKIIRTANFWSRFNLSLPGRVGIFKTLMLSQLSYLGCIITPSELQYATLYGIIENFVKKNLNISKERLYLPAVKGGLGLIDIKTFVMSQQVTWCKKANATSFDCWRYDLKTLGNGNVFASALSNDDIQRHPILNNLVQSLSEFQKRFYCINDNYRSAYVLNNPLIYRERGSTRILDKNFFLQNPPLDFNVLAKLKFSDFFSNGTPILLETINVTHNININLVTYLRICTALGNFYNSLKRNRVTDNTSVSLGTFFSSFQKGSKSVRRIFDHGKNAKSKTNTLTPVKTFF